MRYEYALENHLHTLFEWHKVKKVALTCATHTNNIHIHNTLLLLPIKRTLYCCNQAHT